MDCKLTIFTPTYNRENLLDKLYTSLKNQTDKNFIWLVIDDGSTDNTKEIIKKYIDENIIKIQYQFKENGGKHSAIDYANKICSTDYIAYVDSDDYLTNNAVEELYRLFPLIDKNEDSCGIVLRRAKTDLQPFNSNWVDEDKMIYFYQLAKQYGYNEDTFLIFKTHIASKYHFPKIEGEKFVTEKVYYNQFLFEYKIFASNKLIYVGEYQEDGYTAGSAKLMFKNPKSTYYAFKCDTFYLTKYKVGFKQVLFAWARYYAWRRLNKFKEMFKDEFKIKSSLKPFGWFLSIVFYFRYKKKLEISNN